MKLKRILVLVLTILLCFSVCACGGGDEEPAQSTSNQQESKKETPSIPTRFSVTVVDQNGDLVEGVVLKLEKTTRVTARTNKQGIALFPPVTTDGYKLYVLSCPKGYEYKGAPSYKIKAETGEFFLEITKK